jgi:hypothetical protein
MRPGLTSDMRTLADIMPAVKPRFRDIIGRYEALSYQEASSYTCTRP